MNDGLNILILLFLEAAKCALIIWMIVLLNTLIKIFKKISKEMMPEDLSQ